jgi:hypothetical protein
MGSNMIIWFMCTICNDQIRMISVSITLQFYHFFLVSISPICSCGYFEVITLTLLCRTAALIPPVVYLMVHLSPHPQPLASTILNFYEINFLRIRE